MFQSDTSIFGDKSTPWDTGFARRFLKISDEEKKLLANIPGWSTEETEETRSSVLDDQRILPKCPNQQNISESGKSIRAINAVVLSTDNCETTNTEDIIKVSTANNIERLNCSDAELSTDIEIPTSRSLTKEVSAADVEYANKKNTFMQSISLYAKRVMDVFSGTISRKRSKSLSDIHRAKFDLVMKSSKSESNLTDIDEKTMQNTFGTNKDLQKGDSREAQIFNANESAQTVNKAVLDLNNIEGNHVFMNTRPEIVKNGELLKTLDYVKVAELLNSVNRFFQSSKNAEGAKMLLNAGLNSVPTPSITANHETTLQQKVNILESDQSSVANNVKPNPELIMLEDKHKNIQTNCLPDLISNGSLTKEVAMGVECSETTEKPSTDFISLSNGVKLKENTCPESADGNLHPVASCHPVIMHVSPSKSSTSVLSPNKTASSTTALQMDIESAANLPLIEGTEISTMTTTAGNYVNNLVTVKENITSIVLEQGQKEDIPPKIDNECLIKDQSLKAAVNVAGIAVNGVNTEEKSASIDYDVSSAVNTSDPNHANDKGNLPSITSQEIFTDTLNSTDNTLKDNLPSSNFDPSDKASSNTKYATNLEQGKKEDTRLQIDNECVMKDQSLKAAVNVTGIAVNGVNAEKKLPSIESTDKVLEKKEPGVYTQLKDVMSETPTYTQDSQKYSKPTVETFLEPDVVESTLRESQGAVGATKVDELNRSNSIPRDISEPKKNLRDPNSIEVVDLTGDSSHDPIEENVSKAATKRKRQSKDKPRKKSSFVRSQVQIRYSESELKKMIQLMKMFQPGTM